LLEYRILGPLEIRLEERVLPLAGERQQKLLAVLLLNAGVVVPFDQLITDLWEDPPPTARRQIFNSAVAVRRVVERGDGGRLVTTAHGYRLEQGKDRLDVDAFHAGLRDAESAAASGEAAAAVSLFQNALDLWRGPLLAGLDAESIEAARQGLAEQRLGAVERLAGLLLDLDELTSVIRLLTGQVAEHPLREPLRLTLMRALRRAGRQADALATFEEARVLLADELGVDPGPELRELHQDILRSDAATGPLIPSTRGPCFLPYGTPDFTGRAVDVDRVTAAITNGSAGAPAIVSVEGMGGIGKTALAVHVARALLEDYPDGQYFVDLRGFTEEERPMTADLALDVLLRQSGVPPEQIPIDPHERGDRWRERAAGRSVLLVLDNAADATQVRSLLPGSPDSLVLVTSRNQLVDLDGATPVALEVLPTDESVDLFRRVAGGTRVDGETEAIATVVGLCGGLPLAIRIAAARFRRRRTWTLAYLADQLRDQQRRTRTLTSDNRSVAGVIALSYRQLSPASRRLFRLLALVPGADVDAFASAALAGMSVTEAEDCLEELLECNLLAQTALERYDMHDLVRDCAGDLAAEVDPPEDLRVARHRLFDYFVRFIDVHSRRLTMSGPRFDLLQRYPPGALPESSTQEDDIRHLKAEYLNIVAVTDYASANGWYEHAWQIPCLLLPFFTRVGRRSGVLDLARTALDAARRLHDRRGESLALADLAFALREQGREAEVRQALEEAIEISREIGDLATAGAGLRDLGIAHTQAGRLHEAASAFTEARELARVVGDLLGEVSLTNNLAVLECNLGRYRESLAQFRYALAHHQRTDCVEGEVVSLINIGWVLQLQDDYPEAVVALERAVALSRTIGFQRGEVLAVAWLAVAYRSLGRTAEAIEFGRTALDAARRSDLHEPECDALNSLGESYLAEGRSAEADANFREAERIARDSALPLARGRAWEGLAHLAAAQGKVDRARTLWERALANYQDDVLDAANPRAHLAALDDPDVRCTRCCSGPSDTRRLADRIGSRVS
jgi:DNA-binding SARP family transcriptional activator/tetratricopeptide (TPR) repeat protein